MNLETDYLGLRLKNPLIVGASPFGDNLDSARRVEDAGAAALVMRSLFEEQVDLGPRAGVPLGRSGGRPDYPGFMEYQLTAEHYLEQVTRLRRALAIPVIASLNGHRPGPWTEHAVRVEQAGAHAIELNLYHLATDPNMGGAEIEADMVAAVRDVVRAVRIPVAVKLSPFHAGPAQLARALEQVGARGIVLFNRFYQPDFNLDDLTMQPVLQLSDSSELLLRLRWLAIMSPFLRAGLSCSGGVHTRADVIKALLAGAQTVQVVSVLLREGRAALTRLLEGLWEWMEEHEYRDLADIRGALNVRRCADPTALERANYIRILQSWRV